ncbi:acetoacetate--CoA ligase [Antrihabitans stalactiti]|uniref:Acetoacetate--CoA ligase n=1 Tax=Antrihabitans stalactiti TaxID=2584121 RepID=A0A848KGZ1_9NOCA|nr:acetoacetate--CoA ligase [Antrihabitans stalactiti]NMN96354.1 acetoacetate--CoA ligase [Antrihabitans stalactiti]
MTAQPQWTPSDEDIRKARITAFAEFVGPRAGESFGDYASLWEWSVAHIDEFWTALWDYFDILSPDPGPALESAVMPGAKWFPDARLNYVDQVFRNVTADSPAIVYAQEDGDDVEVSWAQLQRQTAALARTLAELGVVAGDRVVGYLPNIPEAVVAFLATASLGAIWSACGQDYSAPAALDRLGQLDPKVLVTADGYRFNGKQQHRTDAVEQLRTGLSSLVATVLVSRLGEPVDGTVAWESATDGDYELTTVPVPFDHPLWVVFSSGTTGLPKGIMHGHGGVVLEHLKSIAFHMDLSAKDRFFWYTSPSWMMWNFEVAGLLVGSTIVCYDGSPTYPTPDALWQLASRLKATVLGTSPGYVLACSKAGAVPRTDHDLSALRTVGITGSTLPTSSSMWLRDNVGEQVPVASISGGTDVVSAFMGAVPTVPVWPGELSAPYLGVALDAYDEEGLPVRGEVGELVITKPMPSMPVRFWNDPDGHRYHDAYFDTYPGVWRHGDWITITDHGAIAVHGRSDSTLNRNGIRMGSADIYQAVEKLPEIVESLVIGAEQPDGGYWMPLFVVLVDGVELDDALIGRIKSAVREEASPRHVPDEVIVAPAIPHTRTGKKLEVPIKRLFQGADAARIVERSAVDVPELLDWYAAVGAQRSTARQ